MSRDSLTRYLDQIGRYPLLTAFQEIELSRQIRQMVELRDRENKHYTKAEQRIIKIGYKAKEKLMRHNLRLVVHICRRFAIRVQTDSMEMIDYIQEGALGLDRACEMFDGSKGYKFSTYAYWWVKQALRRAADNKARMIRLPVHATEKMLAIKRFMEAYNKQHCKMPSFSEIAAEIEMSEEWVKLLMDRCRETSSLDSFLRDADHQLVDCIVDPNSGGIDQLYEELNSRQLSDTVNLKLSLLPKRDQEALIMRYGLEPGTEPATLDVIGKRLGVSRERSRQIVKKAANKLRLKLTTHSANDASEELAVA